MTKSRAASVVVAGAVLINDFGSININADLVAGVENRGGIIMEKFAKARTAMIITTTTRGHSAPRAVFDRCCAESRSL